jgi:capsular polysaccharide biosynthesis protein
MSMLKDDREKRPNLRLEHSDFRAHYENVAVRTLQSIGRHWRFIASFVALALAAACVVIPLMPRQYSAAALVYPNLFSDEQGKVVPLASVDAASIVTSEARLIVSDAILQAVVKRLGLDLNPEAARSHSWVSGGLDWLRAMLLPETRNHSPFDRQVAMLRNRVEVVKDTRSYLISISFTARSADEAARVVNAIAIEYLRDKTIHRRWDAVVAAEGGLARQLAIYGEKHPKVLQFVDGLDAARAALKAAMSPEDSGQDAIVTDESVKLAIPNRTPTSPKGVVILGLSFMLSLLASIGLTVWRDRLGFEPRQLLLRFLPLDLRFSRHFIAGLVGRGRSAGFLFETPLLRRLRVGLASLVQPALEILNFFNDLWSGYRRRKPGHHQVMVSPGESDQPARRGSSGTAVVVYRGGAGEPSNTTTLSGSSHLPPKF